MCLAGASERGVRGKEETADLLSAGSLSRATASTGMNAQSSRSHAIFTITVEQKKQLKFANEKLAVSHGDVRSPLRYNMNTIFIFKTIANSTVQIGAAMVFVVLELCYC